DGLRHLLAQALGGVVDELAQHHRRDLLRRVLLVAHDEAHAAVRAPDDLVGGALRLLLDLFPGAAHEPLDLEEGALGVQHRLALGHLAYQALVFLERRHGGRGPAALRVHEDARLAAFHDGDDAVRRPQVYTYGLGHLRTPRSLENYRPRRRPEAVEPSPHEGNLCAAGAGSYRLVV